MSSNESWKGKLIKLNVPERYDTWESQVVYLEEKGYKLNDLDVDHQEFHMESSNIAYLDENWYEIRKHELETEYLSEMEYLSNGDISFRFIYYNGGTCFDEMIADEFSRLKKTKRD